MATKCLEYSPICVKEELIYTSCYCEENVWKLIEHVVDKNVPSDELFAVFISNENKTVPIWYQKSSTNIEYPVIWDYHVIMLHKSIEYNQTFIYDLDSNLDFPETFPNYYYKALPVLENIKKEFLREYRVIPAAYFLKNFASDRSHMLDHESGEYMEKIPDYPCIECKASKNNIEEYINMDKNTRAQHGSVMQENEFEKFFTC